MRTRLHQAVALIAVLTAGATASSPGLSADLNNPPPPPLAYGPPPPPDTLFAGWWVGGTVGGATANAPAEERAVA